MIAPNGRPTSKRSIGNRDASQNPPEKRVGAPLDTVKGREAPMFSRKPCDYHGSRLVRGKGPIS